MQEWYTLWINQSKQFFESAEQNLKEMFKEGSTFKPEEHLKQVDAWLEKLKQQWKYNQLSEEQKAHQAYWATFANMYTQATDLMLEQWKKRSQDNPIKSTRELYDLWLNCCSEVYQKSQQTQAFDEFRKAAVKFWDNLTPPK